MKSIITYINEALKLGASKKRYSFAPKDKYELYRYIKDYIKKNGNDCDLNHIDVSKLDDLSCLFQGSEFDGDISGWDVSNVEYMEQTFLESKFTGKNGDISKWDVRNVRNFRQMFDSSNIEIDLSNWEVQKGANMEYMFDNTSVKRPKWYTRINETLELGKTRNTFNLTVGPEKQKDFARLLNEIWGKKHHNITVTPGEDFATVDYVSDNDIIKIACLVDNMFQPSNWNFEDGEYDKNDVDCAYHYIPNSNFLNNVSKLLDEIDKENEKVAAIAREINW